MLGIPLAGGTRPCLYKQRCGTLRERQPAIDPSASPGWRTKSKENGPSRLARGGRVPRTRTADAALYKGENCSLGILQESAAKDRLGVACSRGGWTAPPATENLGYRRRSRGTIRKSGVICGQESEGLSDPPEFYSGSLGSWLSRPNDRQGLIRLSVGRQTAYELSRSNLRDGPRRTSMPSETTRQQAKLGSKR